MAVESVSSAGQSTQQASTTIDAWSSVNLDSFISLLVTELQNQDPMEPMKSQEILGQISQIREIESNQRLTETLESVQLGQSLATASSLLGQIIEGLSDNAETISGQVDRVSIEDGVAKLHVGDSTITLTNLGQILSASVAEEDNG